MELSPSKPCCAIRLVDISRMKEMTGLKAADFLIKASG